MSGKYEKFGDIDVAFAPAVPPEEHPMCDYEGYHPGTTVLPRGHVRRPGMMPLPAAMIWDRDVTVELRDGTKIVTNIYRPVTDEKVPAIVGWGDFGRLGGTHNFDIFPNRCGIPLDSLSGYEKYEGPDPGYWVQFGYAVVCPDARGAYESEGDIYDYGSQIGEDGCDLIEWLAKQKWCNGKIGLSGNSQLAISQWFIGAENPPHLAAIAPWEGASDMYRDFYYIGGIANDKSTGRFGTCGRNRIEDMPEMIRRYPCFNGYWEDKRSKPEKITAPAYIVASYTNFYHTHGTFDNYRRLGSKEKWLRVNNTLEWPDYYDPCNKVDLLKFFDHYLKGKNNGWENTPKIRLSVLDPGTKKDIVGRMEREWPLARQQFKTLYLDAADGSMSFEKPEKESAAAYNTEELIDCGPEPDFMKDGEQAVMDHYNAVHDKQRTDFVYTFDKDTEITGYCKAKLWVEAVGNDDMDVFVRISTLDAEGVTQFHDAIWYNYTGPKGQLRVSMRELNKEKSTPSEPYLDYNHPQKLSPGEVVPIEIGFWPTAQIFRKGESICLTVAGFDYLGKKSPAGFVDTINKGDHIIHTGGKYDSHLLVPVIPEP